MRNVWENYGQTGRDIAESADRDAAWVARELGDCERRTPGVTYSHPDPLAYHEPGLIEQPIWPPTDDATIGAGYHSLGGIGYGVRGMPAGEYIGVEE